VRAVLAEAREKTSPIAFAEERYVAFRHALHPAAELLRTCTHKIAMPDA
jgi:hypothetical protein